MLNEIKVLEEKLSSFYGYDNVILVGRARSGILALTEVLGLAGKDSIIPSNICPVVPVAFDASGMNIRLAAVNPLNGLADDDRLINAMKISKRPGLVMPSHLYGQLSSYKKSKLYSSNNNWFVLENDTLCAARISNNRRKAFGDALLTSFGYSKTASAGLGGAILTDDGVMSKEIRRIVSKWPTPNDETIKIESNIMLTRRCLRNLGRSDLSEGLIDTEKMFLKHSFPTEFAKAVISALDKVDSVLERNAEMVAVWNEKLKGLNDYLKSPLADLPAPWRLIKCVSNPSHRDSIANELRNIGIDVGINFPALTDSFPTLLAGQSHPDSESWANSVLNFWIDDSVNESKINTAVNNIKATLFSFTK